MLTGLHYLPEPLHFTNIETSTNYIFYDYRHDQIILSILRVGHNLLTVQKKHVIFTNLEV